MDERSNKEERIYDKYFIDINNKQTDEILPKLDKLQNQIDTLRNDLDDVSTSKVQIMEIITLKHK